MSDKTYFHKIILLVFRFSLSKYSGHSVKYIRRFFQTHQNRSAHALAEIFNAFKNPKHYGLHLFSLIASHKLLGFGIRARSSGTVQDPQMVLQIFLHAQE